MSTRPHLLAVLFTTLAVTLGACSSAEDNDATGVRTPAPTTTTTTVADLATVVETPGDWAVGVRSAEVTGARDRILPVQIWYPVDPEHTGDAELATYPFPGLSVPSAMGLADAPVAPGPFPLVVYSHGNGGLRYVSAFLTEHLASHGFIVVAPDHVGNTAVDSFAGTSEDRSQVALDRPLDISETISAALAGESGFEDTAPQTDPENIGVIGHSFGGFTALAVAGGLAEQPPDQRVDTIVGLAAATNGLSDDVLDAIEIPTLFEWATDDQTVEVATNAPRPDERISGRPYVRADIQGAEHQSFTEVCSYQDILAEMPEAPAAIVDAVDDYASEGCEEGQLDIDEAHRIILRLTTAFLLEQLWGDDTYVPLLNGDTGADPTLARLEHRG
jgi:predicted dienelactone hydrolase